MERITDAVGGNIPPWCKRIVKQAGRGINRFRMIEENDRVLLGISGGKDSLALAFALQVRKVWLPVDYTLHAVIIDWREHPLPPDNREKLLRFFEDLTIPCEIVPAHLYPESFNGRFDCYLCARNRKRILFKKAEELDFEKIALGHHLDDIVETTLINLCLRGNFSTMMPVQDFFGGKIRLIRPLCEVPEKDIIKLSDRYGFPVHVTECPFKDTNIRSRIKPIIRELSKLNREVRNHIYSAHLDIDRDYSDFSGILP